MSSTPETQTARRKHRKSRNGCAECKRRRIKCDEQRPTCWRCQVAGRQCPFQSLTATLPPRPEAEAEAEAEAESDPDVVTVPPSVPPADLTQCRLLYHFISAFDDILPAEVLAYANLTSKTFIEAGLTCPYLLNQTLAFSARHLAAQAADPEEHLLIARTYQTYALGAFNALSIEPGPENCVQIVCFSWLLGVQLLSDVSLEENKPNVLETFLHFLDVFRGARTVVVQAWTHLSRSSLGPSLQQGESRAAAGKSPDVGCAPEPYAVVETLIAESRGMSEQWKTAARDALAHLEPFIAGTEEQLTACFQLVFSWPLAMDADFHEAIRAGRPEALIVLAHFSVVMHWCRRHWILAFAGERLLDAIVARLGPGWERWLLWPTAKVRGEPVTRE